MGGSSVSVRFYLGRLVGRNLFRESDAEVEVRLADYVSQLTSATGANLSHSLQGWDVAGDILRYRFEIKTKGKSCLKRLHIASIETFLTDPSLTFAELAQKVGTTEKQLNRNASLTVARKILATNG